MNLKQIRKEQLKLSQAELAAKLYVAQETVSAWERGFRNMPKIYIREIQCLINKN